MAKKRGRPVKTAPNPDVKGRPIVVHVSEAEHAKFKAAADAEERTLSAWIRRACLAALEKAE